MRECNSLVGELNLLGVREGKLASAHICGLRWVPLETGMCHAAALACV